MTQDRHMAPFTETPASPQHYMCAAMYTIQAGDTLYSISHRYGVPVSALMQANNIDNPYSLQIDQQICIPSKENVTDNNLACDGFLHVIVAGDTPYLLSKHYGVSLDAILEANPTVDPHNLMIGAQLCIPGVSSPRPTPPPVPMPMPMPMPGDIRPEFPEAPTPIPIPVPTRTPTPAPMPARPPVQAPTPERPPTPAPIQPVPEPVIPPQMPEILSRQDSTPVPKMVTPVPELQTPVPEPLTPRTTPMPTVETTPECDIRTYTVSEGDTLYMIAKNNGVTLKKLMDANPNLDLYNLEIGMALCIPDVLMAPVKANQSGLQDQKGFYIVRKNDNMDRICDLFEVMPRNLMKANPELTIVDYSMPGTKICIPNS